MGYKSVDSLLLRHPLKPMLDFLSPELVSFLHNIEKGVGLVSGFQCNADLARPVLCICYNIKQRDFLYS